MNITLALTDTQKKLIMVLAGLFGIDNLITLYGVFFYGPGFYEANPICRYFLEISPGVFAGALTLMKIAGILILIGMVHFCNTWKDHRNNGQAWGTRLAALMTFSMGSALAVLTYVNVA